MIPTKLLDNVVQSATTIPTMSAVETTDAYARRPLLLINARRASNFLNGGVHNWEERTARTGHIYVVSGASERQRRVNLKGDG